MKKSLEENSQPMENKDANAKLKALLEGLEVQHIEDLLNTLEVEEYRELGESISMAVKKILAASKIQYPQKK